MNIYMHYADPVPYNQKLNLFNQPNIMNATPANAQNSGMTRYKFRCEVISDYTKIKKAFPGNRMTNVKGSMTFIEDILIPDASFVFDSVLSLNELLEILDTITDMHVPFQTLQPIRKYTGKRNYNRIIEEEKPKNPIAKNSGSAEIKGPTVVEPITAKPKDYQFLIF